VLLDADIAREASELDHYISSNFQLPESGFYYSLLNNKYANNLALGNHIHQTLNSFYDSFFCNHKIRTESFLVKMAKTESEFFLHQDWSYTDERKFDAYNIWIPLQDVTLANGAMFFIPGSHLWFDNIRSGSLPSSRISYTMFPDDAIKKVEVAKGQVVLFNPAVFHGSMPNNSAENRSIVTATVFSESAPFLYFDRKKDPRGVDVYRLDDDMFLRDLESMAFGGTPQASIIDRREYIHRDISVDDLLAHIRRS
jgi:hypothetical protein